VTDHIPGPTRVCFSTTPSNLAGFDSESSVEDKPCFRFIRRPFRRIPEIGEIHFRQILVMHMSRYTKFAVLTTVLAVFVGFPVFVAEMQRMITQKRLSAAGSGRVNLTSTTPMGHGASSATKTHPRTLEAAGEWRATGLSSRARPMMVSLLLHAPLSRARTTH
jgi:hypothetical protein